MRTYVPKRGDLVWINFTPHAGHEQGGRRPALTVSDLAYNRSAGLAVFCPVTNQAKGYPFEVSLPSKGRITGVVLADHVRSMDFAARECEHVASVPKEVMDAVTAKLKALLVLE